MGEELTWADKMIIITRCSLLVFDTKSKIGLIFSEIVTSKVLTMREVDWRVMMGRFLRHEQ